MVVGYANVSVLDLLLHLGATYGHITPAELASNCNPMITPYDMQDPVETLFYQIDKGVHLAEAGQHPYNDAQYVNIAFILIFNTGSLPEAIREWQRRTLANQTWPQL
jgi:hypothetical protein